MSTARKPRMYVNNVDFLKALLDYKETCKTNPNAPIPNYIGECWLKIGEGLSHKPNFISYTYRDEMISDGIENCLLYFNNFDPEISKNPFAYFTQIIYYAFLRRIEQENDELYVKYKSMQNMGILGDHEFEGVDGGKPFELYENIAEFIEKYEAKKLKKKAEKAAKAAAKLPPGLDSFMED